MRTWAGTRCKQPADRGAQLAMNAVLTIPPLPRCIVMSPPLTDEEFETLCLSNDNVQFERTRDGEILMNPLTGLFTGHGNSEIIHQLRAWWKQHRKGIVVDSNTGFFLSDGSMLSPDAAYLPPARLRGITAVEAAHFLRVCPDFVIELLSASDRLSTLQAKMERWIENGAELGWLIDPYSQEVWIYQLGYAPRLESGAGIEGKGPVEGFRLDLVEVWRCFESFT
jgi:Uma2 family endonuclease